MEYEEFLEEMGEADAPQKDSEFNAFLFFCFRSLFDENDPAGDFLAAIAAHSFCRKNYVKATGAAHRACYVRYPRKPKPSVGLKMKM